MIVHFIGCAGSGKSALVQHVAAEGGFRVPPQGVKRFLSLADWLFPVAYPLSWPLGRRLVAHNRKGKKCPGSWGWAGSIAMQKARRWAFSYGRVYLVDQAMTNVLRKWAGDTAAGLFDEMPLPDMVVYINVTKAVRMARVVLRNKSGYVPSYVTGERAQTNTEARARRWSALWGADEAMRCLRAWNRLKCRPKFTEGDLKALLDDAQARPLTEKDKAALRSEPLPERVRWLHDACVDRGVLWLNVVNDGRESPEVIAMRIVEEIKRLNGNGR